MLQTLTAFGGRKIDPLTNESELPMPQLTGKEN